MRYIQSNLIFYGFTISFHHSKEVFVCCLIVSLRCVFWVGLSIRGGGIDSPRPASQRAAALVLTAAMLTTFTAPAFAKTWYIEDGDITISASETKGTNKVSQGAEPEVEDTGTIITNREKDASSHTVTINAGNDKVEVTLDNVNIKADSGSALISKGDVTLTLKGDNHLTGGNGGSSSYGGDGITSSGSLTISGGTVTATGGDSTSSVGSGGSGISSNGSLTITGGENDSLTAKGGSGRSGIFSSSGGVTISGGTVTATGGKSGSGDYSNGGNGISSSGSLSISGGTVTATAGSSSGSYGRDGITTSSSLTISGGTVTANGGSGSYRGGSGISSSDIELSGSLELTAKAGSPNGKALSQNGIELDPNTFKEKLDPGANIITKDADGKVIDQVSSPRPVEPEGPVIPEESSSSSDSGSSTPSADGGSATPSAPASPLPGLTVTDKDGQRISYTSIRGNNVLSIRAGRFTASLHASLSTLRQLRAEGIDTITFRTVLCSTTLSVDELLAMGGEDAEVVLTHHIRSSTLTVGGKAV